LDTLTPGDAPLLEYLPLAGPRPMMKLTHRYSNSMSYLYIKENAALNHQWSRDSIANIEFVTISRGDRGEYSFDIARALEEVPRRIPCLTLDNVELDPLGFGVEKVILQNSVVALTEDHVDDDRGTIAFRNRTVSDLLYEVPRLPSSLHRGLMSV